MESSTPPPLLRKSVFWSDDLTLLNYTADAEYIIRQIFDAGTYPDMTAAIAYYGKEAVRNALLSAPVLQTSTIAYASLWLQCTPDDFASHQRQKSNPQPFKSF